MPDNQKNLVIMGNQMLSKAKSCQAHTEKIKGRYPHGRRPFFTTKKYDKNTTISPLSLEYNAPSAWAYRYSRE